MRNLLKVSSALFCGLLIFPALTPPLFATEEFPGKDIIVKPGVTDLSINRTIESIPAINFPNRDRSGGPDDFGYRWRDIEEDGVDYEWIDIRQGDFRGEVVQNVGDDTNHGPFEMGWDFPFYGQNFNTFRVCSNGWISFTNESTFYSVGGEDSDFPHAGNYPENVIAPFMTDLYPSGENIWYYTNADQRILIVSWIGIQAYGDRNLSYTFQIILRGNGRIKFQYQTNQQIDDGHQVIAGIQNSQRNIGLTIFRGAGVGVPSNEYAVDISKALGWVTGSVTNLATGEPLAGALLTLSDNTQSRSNEDGVYWLREIVADPYTLTASLRGFNSVTSDRFEVADQETTTVDFALPHPEIRVNVDSYNVVLPQQGEQQEEFRISNDGNGPLEFTIRYTVPTNSDEIGDVIFDWDATDKSGDQRLRGITTDGEYYYVSGSNNNDEPNKFYVFNWEGELVRVFDQPHRAPSTIGLKGLATDGEFLYASDSREIYQISINNDEVARSFAGPFNPTRYLVYDPATDHLWGCEITSRVAEFDRDGNIIRQYDKPPRVYGLAWYPDDPDGFKLYFFHRIPDGNQTALAKMNPENGQILNVAEFNFRQGDIALDCAITNGYNPLIWMFVALIENNVNDRIVGAELALNTSWVQTEPMSGTIEPESNLDISIGFFAGDWLPGVYGLDLVIAHNAISESIRIPLCLIISDAGFEPLFYNFITTEIRHNFFITSVDFLGVPAETGDEIGVFTPDALCVGGAIWFDDRMVAVPAFGDDQETDEIDGFREEQAFAFRFWDGDADYDNPAVFTRSSGDESFRNGGSTRGSLVVQNREDISIDPLETALPKESGLAGAYPNPFNSQTSISYMMAQSGNVSIALYDIKGRQVRVIEQTHKNAGYWKVTLPGEGLPSGTYIVKMQTANVTKSMKVLLIR